MADLPGTSSSKRRHELDAVWRHRRLLLSFNLAVVAVAAVLIYLVPQTRQYRFRYYVVDNVTVGMTQPTEIVLVSSGRLAVLVSKELATMSEETPWIRGASFSLDRDATGLGLILDTRARRVEDAMTFAELFSDRVNTEIAKYNREHYECELKLLNRELEELRTSRREAVDEFGRAGSARGNPPLIPGGDAFQVYEGIFQAMMEAATNLMFQDTTEIREIHRQMQLAKRALELVDRKVIIPRDNEQYGFSRMARLAMVLLGSVVASVLVVVGAGGLGLSAKRGSPEPGVADGR